MTYLDAEGDGPMNHDYDDERDLDEDAPGLSSNPFDRTRQQAPSPDPHDDGLDDSFEVDGAFNVEGSLPIDDAFLDNDYDEFEEPERDTVQSGSSTEMYYEEEEDIDDLFADEPDFEEEGDSPEYDAPALSLVDDQAVTTLSPTAHDSEAEDLSEPEEWPTTGAAAGLAATRWQEEQADESPDEQDWQGDEAFLEDEDDEGPQWPFGLIAVAVVALVLLVAGGYGVIQQRQATEEEIRQLRAELATAASPSDVSASRQALQDMKAQNDELSRQVESLTRDNRRLADTVAGLEAQLVAQQAALAKAKTDEPAAQTTQSTPAPAASSPPAAQSTAAPTGNWFVNFGSYGQEAIAREWAGRLNPGNGEAVLVAAEVNGRSIYRVRVVGLSDRDSAERVARALEAKYDLPKLWVGKQ